MSIIIGADLVPTKSNEALFNAGDAKALIGDELLSVLNSAAFRVFNLEVPLTDKEMAIKKCGPNLIAPTSTINGIKNIGVDLFTIANNHIMDQDAVGLKSTITVLNNAGICFVGAGGNLQEASKPYILKKDGMNIGVYACVEHEFSIANDHMPGANPFDPLYSFDHVSELKKQCDFVIVLYHGGKEYYRYPSPELQRYCRRFIEKGADLIVCQHSHCIGCEEKYLGGTIVYGQGNFLFDNSESVYWQTSLLIQINEAGEISYIPIVKNGNTVRLAKGENAKDVIDQFNKRSEDQDPDLLTQQI